MIIFSHTARRASLLGSAAVALSLALGLIAPVPAFAATSAPRSVSAIAFATAQTGWAGGASGILATTDGGKTWRGSYSGPATIVAFSVLSPTRVWAVATDRLLGTTDGGRHWATLGEPSKPLRKAVFTSASQGWGVTATTAPFTGGMLVHTTDGGRHWQRVAMPSTVDSVCFAGSQAGWAADQKIVLRTTDGGKTWHTAFKAPLGTGESHWSADVGCAGSGVAWVQFTSAGGGMNQAPFVVYHTADGGAHWSAALEEGYYASLYPTAHTAQRPPGYPGPFAVANGSTAYFLTICAPCGGLGAIIVTATGDGGKTWRQTQLPSLPAGPVGVAFSGAASGWIAGAVQREQGPTAILHTMDGGKIWARQYPH